jgi:hypothetical protein
MQTPITQADPPDEVEARYRAALDAFVERVRQDPYEGHRLPRPPGRLGP